MKDPHLHFQAHRICFLSLRLPVGVILGLMEKKMEATMVYWGYMGIMEKKMEATIVYWGYTGIMEKKIEATM